MLNVKDSIGKIEYQLDFPRRLNNPISRPKYSLLITPIASLCAFRSSSSHVLCLKKG